MFPPPFLQFPQPYGFFPYYGGYAPEMGLSIQVVTAANFEAELNTIAALLRRFPVIAIDAEYPGTVHRPPAGRREGGLTPDERYTLVKANVDELPVVRLGITLCDADGNVPLVAGRPCEQRAWEFIFSDFDLLRDRHAPESVAFLRSRGVDFRQAREGGVRSAAFAARLAAVLAPAQLRGDLAWAAFGGAYDFAYMVKMLSGGQPLPGTWHEFIAQARALLGGRVFDGKYMAEHSGRPDLCRGGLRSVAARLGVPLPNPAPPCLAGPKSHTACGIYTAMRRHFRDHDHGACFDGLIDGFH
ncbi:probable CCR4-associated factor 1 homolog 11 [Panicum hallii]|jgi:CCR4-NOT transcription complex subunit 7/8|nr:probable CCR4-associated factor 1 homolog 11 [Panicum hallii]